MTMTRNLRGSMIHLAIFAGQHSPPLLACPPAEYNTGETYFGERGERTEGKRRVRRDAPRIVNEPGDKCALSAVVLTFQ